MYNPSLGVFVQRDPLGTPLMSPVARNLSGPQYTQRDSMEQYTDGPNLYQYAAGSPVNLRDPSGLWSAKVHDKMTRDAISSIDASKLVPSPIPGEDLVIIEIVTAANIAQDTNAPGPLGRFPHHYTRDLKQDAGEADKDFAQPSTPGPN